MSVFAAIGFCFVMIVLAGLALCKISGRASEDEDEIIRRQMEDQS